METKKKIMDSAFRLFAEVGNEFSLNEVACEVGIQKASIYAHFTSKEDLLYLVLDKEINSYQEKINGNCSNLREMFFAILNYFEGSRAKLYLWKRLLLFTPRIFEETLAEKIEDMTTQHLEKAKELILKDMESGAIRKQDLEPVAYLYFSIIQGILSGSIMFKSKDLKQYYENYWRIFQSGVN